MGITSPRNLSIIAILVLLLYLFLFLTAADSFPSEFHLVFLLILGSLTGTAAFGFAINEWKETEGVTNVFDIGVSRLIGSFVFAILIAVGYDGLILILLEMISGGNIEVLQGIDIPIVFLQIIVGFLIIYPFFQFLTLARPGEDSSIPVEYPIEAAMEVLRDVLRSPLLSALFSYSLVYILPILLLTQWTQDFALALLLWALILPLITIGALAGAGFGEDLIRLRLLQRPIKDLPKLGLPKLNLKELSFDIGGLFLVLIAIQALLTTAYFGFLGIGTALGIRKQTVGELVGLSLVLLLLTLFNKGRGAFKELKEVWRESGFKVNTFQLFLPVFVFLGVILSSALEVFVQQSDSVAGVLADIGLINHVQLAALILVLQNFVLITTAIYILKRTPGAAERRLIKEVPDFYEDDIDGYLYIYEKLRDDRSVENLIRELTKKMKKNPIKANILQAFLEKTLQSEDKDVQIASAEALHLIVQRIKSFDNKLYELNKIALNTQSVGARIYAIRNLKVFLTYLEGVEKEEAIKYLQSFLGDEDPVISWDTSIVLQRILMEDQAYRSFALAHTIRTLNTTTSKSSLDAIKRFFKKIARDSTEIGQMAISTLAVQLSTGDNENPENLIEGIKALLRGNSMLAEDLIDQVAVGIQHPDHDFRMNSYLVLTNMAQYGTGREQEILELVLNGINDSSLDIQEIAYRALTKEVVKAPDLANQIYVILVSKFEELRGISLLGALNVIKSIIELNTGLESEILSMIQGASNSNTPKVRAVVLEIVGEIAQIEPSTAELVYNIAVNNIGHETDIVRQHSISTLGKMVTYKPDYAPSVYREVKKARDDQSFIVQLAAIESLGYVASATTQFADEIISELTPLLNDQDWQVRLAALNGLFASVEKRPTLGSQLVDALLITLLDVDRTIRLRSLDMVNWVTDNRKRELDKIINLIVKRIKYVDPDIQTTLVESMELIAEDSILSIPIILSLLEKVYDATDNNLRFAANETLKISMAKLKSTRKVSSSAHSALNSLLSALLKAANNSNASIRRTAYQGITEICAGLPEIKVSDRGRSAIAKAIKLEKDVGLQDYLEEARIRSKRPLDLKNI